MRVILTLVALLLSSVAHAQATSRTETTPWTNATGEADGVQVRLVGTEAAVLWGSLQVPLSGPTYGEKRGTSVVCRPPNGVGSDYRCLFWIHADGRVTPGELDETRSSTVRQELRSPAFPTTSFPLGLDHATGDAVWSGMTSVETTNVEGVGGLWKRSAQISCGEVFGMDFTTIVYHSCFFRVDGAGTVGWQ